MFAEPPPSQGDLHFTLLGIPVRVHPLFWVVALILGLNGRRRMVDVFICVVAVFVSILVHELGHALTMRRLGLRPWIVLHGMGGLAGYDTAQLHGSRASGWVHQVLISAAGPGAGFLLALVVAGIVKATGHSVDVSFGAPYGVWVGAEGISEPALDVLVNSLLFISVIWGLVNLLPVYPLDGGQIAREVFLRLDARKGIPRSLILSTVVAAALAVWELAQVISQWRILAAAGAPTSMIFQSGSLYVAMLFGYLAYVSYATLDAYRRQGPRW
jgi:membrane-associated protease RseP (regulator of RpoE activity)